MPGQDIKMRQLHIGAIISHEDKYTTCIHPIAYLFGVGVGYEIGIRVFFFESGSTIM